MQKRCLVNSRTNRASKKGTRTYNVLKQQPPLRRDCAVNPISQRAFRIGTPTHRRLWMEGFEVPEFPVLEPKAKRSTSPRPVRRSSRCPGPAGYRRGEHTRIAARPLQTTLRLQSKRLPALELKNSFIPDAGQGLFAAELIPKNALITEYGGRLVDRQEAERLRRRGEDTHLRAVTLGKEALDSRIQPPTFTRDYYASNHLLGGFANQAPTRADQNAIYVNERGPGRQHPYGDFASDRVFLKASRDIEPGCEVLVNYAGTYKRLHL